MCLSSTFILVLIHSLVLLVRGFPSPGVPPPPVIDPENPSASDPTSPPSSISFPPRAPKPPSGSEFSTQPPQCDGEAPSDECFKAMSDSGGYLWFAKDSQCSNDDKTFLETALWDAHTLALYSSTFPNVDGARGSAAGTYYMGPDFSQFQGRIAGNFKRAAEFKTPSTSEKTYITVSCQDTKNYCKKKAGLGSKVIGGYGWSHHGLFGWYHYITVCPPLLTLSTMDEKLQEISEDLAKGDTRKASNMDYLKNSGQFFLHEMMHTRLVYNEEPEIIDEVLNPNEGELIKVYGARLVHKKARFPLNQGGGAKHSSTNADSYAILANALWWWGVTGYFPAAVPSGSRSSNLQDQLKEDPDYPVMLHVDLGDIKDVKAANFDALFESEL